MDQPEVKNNYNITWTPEMDNLCMDAFIVEYWKGGKPNNRWQPPAYEAVTNVMNEKTGHNFTKENLENRMQTWEDLYRTIIQLTKQDGFRWNDVKKIVEADDATWSKYLKSDPAAATYRYKTCEEFDKIGIIVGDTEATGAHAMTGHHITPTEFLEEDLEIERPTSNGLTSAEAVLLGALAPGVNPPTWFLLRIVFLLLGLSLTAMLALAFSSSDVLIVGLVFMLVVIGAVLFILLNGQRQVCERGEEVSGQAERVPEPEVSSRASHSMHCLHGYGACSRRRALCGQWSEPFVQYLHGYPLVKYITSWFLSLA